VNAQTDRELLKLAARAAGMPMCSEWDAATDGVLIGSGKGDLSLWNPLTDDGDALRLAVKLVRMKGISTTVGWFQRSRLGEPHKDDPCAATRRAIVRTAAAVGASTLSTTAHVR